MKFIVPCIILFFFASPVCFSQDMPDPIQMDKIKEDLQKIKDQIEREKRVNAVDSTVFKQTQLDQLVNSLDPIPEPHYNTNPANGPVAPKGVYNTSDTSKILIDEEVFNGRKSNTPNAITNESKLLIVLAIMGVSILGLIGYIIKKK